ncbi:MAG: prepilin-type N-terminal cleavage/methylation domain-containing protein, partial [Acaryochloridaceae cyanobacterium RL_2_7]|nr:prepilin-type N-terminal cleavage/methylation domain-containing protein [Acaryochloridaceae cyanobacterium RL_2_7]
MRLKFVPASRWPNVAKNNTSGFTLTELMTATAILGIVIGLVWSSLISMISSTQRAEEELDRKRELNRAADFIVDDIQEAAQVSGTVTLSGANAGVFEITKNDGQRVAYFMRPQGLTRWKGPYILYRKTTGMHHAQALVDGLSDQTPICLAQGGQVKQSAGFKVIMVSNKHLKICLAGNLIDNEVFL